MISLNIAPKNSLDVHALRREVAGRIDYLKNVLKAFSDVPAKPEP